MKRFNCGRDLVELPDMDDNTMFCPKCRAMLLHRRAPDPPASRCTNDACATVFDAAGAETVVDHGPWPEPEEIESLEGINGSISDGRGGSWTYRRGTSSA